MSDKKCDELIADRMAGRLEDLLPDFDELEVEDALELASDLGVEAEDFLPTGAGIRLLVDELRDRHRDRVLDGVLSVDVRKSYRVLLSWGGPSDGFDFVFNNDGELVECYYFYQDWFDGAKRPVDMEQAAELAQLYCVGPEFE
jgi:hypothetical protein